MRGKFLFERLEQISHHKLTGQRQGHCVCFSVTDSSMCCPALPRRRQDNLCAVTKTTRTQEEDQGLQKSSTLLLHVWMCTQIGLEISSRKGK